MSAGAAPRVGALLIRVAPFETEEFSRRHAVTLLGTSGFIATVEDLILAKLEWAAATGSDGQVRDVAGMLAVSGDMLDQPYVARWAAHLGLSEMWNKLNAP